MRASMRRHLAEEKIADVTVTGTELAVASFETAMRSGRTSTVARPTSIASRLSALNTYPARFFSVIVDPRFCTISASIRLLSPTNEATKRLMGWR
jgi:hypothetical protein